MRSGKIFFVAAALLVASPVVAQDVFTFQDGVSPTPDYAGTQDTHIISWDDGDLSGSGVNQLLRNDDGSNAGATGDQAPGLENPQNMGGLDLMEEGDNGGGSTDSKVLLIQFDLLGSIPASRGVSNARIGLYFDQLRDGNDNPPHILYVNRVLKAWAEGDGADPVLYPDAGYDGNDTPDNSGAVTWNSTGFEFWQAMGAEGPEDIAPTESQLWIEPGQVDEWIWFDVTQSASIWVADPSQNHGVKISQEVYPVKFNAPDLQIAGGPLVYSAGPTDDPTVYENARFVFRTSEHADTATHPQLVIELLASSSAGDWSLYR